MNTTKIILFFILNYFISLHVYCQNTLLLNITSKDTIENSFIKTLTYNKKHSTKKSLKTTVTNTIKKIQAKGYLSVIIDSIEVKNNNHKYWINLNEKTNWITIYNTENKTYKTIKIKDVESYLDSIARDLSIKGKIFSEVKLSDIKLQKKTLTALLITKQTKTRTINNVIIKGYDKFPKTFLKHYLKVNKHSIFNKKELLKIHKAIEKLDFITQTSPPQTLFSKDSTNIYLYIKKKKANNIDGIISFANNESFEINGNLNLSLKNIFNTGEKFYLNWIKQSKTSQNLNLSTSFPYIFKSPLSQGLSLEIYKKDSSFINTTFKTTLAYTLNTNTNIGLSFTAQNSSTISEKPTKNINDFENQFFGLEYTLKGKKNKNIDKQNSLTIAPSYGFKKSDNKTINQIKLFLELSYLIQLNKNNYLFFKNQSGFLTSKEILLNEYFRIGGNNSIRGFTDRSIFTKNFSFINTNYIINFGKQSSFSFFVDIGKTESKFIYGLGIEYCLTSKKNKIKFQYSYGTLNSFKKGNSLIGLQLINNF